MIELGQLTASVLNKDENLVLFSFMEGGYFHVFVGNCDEINHIENRKIIKLDGVGFYADITHSLELKDYYEKYNMIASKFNTVRPQSADELYNKSLKLNTKCKQKRNYGFKVSFLSDNIIEIVFLVDKTQFTLSCEKDCTFIYDDKHIITCKIDDNIPFMNHVLDDTYIDLTSLLSVEKSIHFLQTMAEGLTHSGFKVINSYNVENQ